jgi:hypothetical protein
VIVLPRDFVETAEGLIFAVVEAGLEDGKALCFLRYRRTQPSGMLRKCDTDTANSLLRESYPQYLHHSHRLDADLHGAAVSAIVAHYRPTVRMAALLGAASAADPLERRLCRLASVFIQCGVPPDALGVTGSLLLGAQNPDSDIDLVVYGRNHFHAARAVLRQGLQDGQWRDLNDGEWQETYRRRGAALSFDEFVWHERRKANKAVFDGTKFDLTQVDPEPRGEQTVWRKRGPRFLEATVLDDAASFDYPARYRIDHPDIPEICVHTHTYVGQASRGERIEASGFLEQTDSGMRRLSIGSSREAPGEYLRVVR